MQERNGDDGNRGFAIPTAWIFMPANTSIFGRKGFLYAGTFSNYTPCRMGQQTEYVPKNLHRYLPKSVILFYKNWAETLRQRTGQRTDF